MAIALDDAPVTLNRPLLDGETLAVTLRRGVGRAGVRLVGETAAYTVWIETSGIAVLDRDGAEQGRVPVAGDAQRVTLTYASGTLTASVGAYAFPPISDGTAFASLRAEFVVQGGNGQGSTFDDVTVPLPPGLMMNLPQPTLVPTALTSEELGFQLLSEAAPTSSLAVIPDELSFTFDDGLDPFQWFSGEFGMTWTADAGYQLAITADTAPVTLLRPIQAEHTISAAVRPGTGEAGLRYAGAADEYTLWVSATGAARLQRNGVDVGQTALDTNTEYQLSMRYSAGVLYASLNDYDFPVISDPDPLTLWRLELMIAGGAGVGSTFDNITVTAPAAELLAANTQSLSTAIGGQPRLFREVLGGTTLPQGYYGGILPQATSHTLFGTQNRVVQTVRADGSLATLTIQPSSTHEVATSADIAVSPDGQRLAVECTGYGSFGGGYSICIVDLLPTPRIIYAMTMPQGYTLNPTWLSDSLIAFSAFGSLGSTSEIYAVGATAAAFYGRIANCLYPQGSVSTVFCVNLTSNYPLYAAQLANVQPNGWIPAQPVASSPQHIAAFAVMAAANGQFTLGAAAGTTCSNGTDPGPNSNDCQIGLWTLSAQTGSWTAAAIPAYQSALTFNGYRQNISEVEFSEGQSKLLISRFTAAGEIPSPQHQAYVWEWKVAPANEFTKISTDVAGMYVNYGWSLSSTLLQQVNPLISLSDCASLPLETITQQLASAFRFIIAQSDLIDEGEVRASCRAVVNTANALLTFAESVPGGPTYESSAEAFVNILLGSPEASITYSNLENTPENSAVVGPYNCKSGPTTIVCGELNMMSEYTMTHELGHVFLYRSANATPVDGATIGPCPLAVGGVGFIGCMDDPNLVNSDPNNNASRALRGPNSQTQFVFGIITRRLLPERIQERIDNFDPSGQYGITSNNYSIVICADFSAPPCGANNDEPPIYAEISDWERGVTGWDIPIEINAPDRFGACRNATDDYVVTNFQQNPCVIYEFILEHPAASNVGDVGELKTTEQEETGADMFLNWVYRTVEGAVSQAFTDNESGNQQPTGRSFLNCDLTSSLGHGDDRFCWMQENLRLFFQYYGW